MVGSVRPHVYPSITHFVRSEVAFFYLCVTVLTAYYRICRSDDLRATRIYFQLSLTVNLNDCAFNVDYGHSDQVTDNGVLFVYGHVINFVLRHIFTL